MNIFKVLIQDLKKYGKEICDDDSIWQKAKLEIPKDNIKADIATNIAMIIAAHTKSNPREVATQFKTHWTKIDYIDNIEIAGPGFINFIINQSKWYQALEAILADKQNFYHVDVGGGLKVNIEYVSANPTGPMHVGHARGAVWGDALANILKHTGHNVTKEYYINDAGAQIEVLVDSVILRYKEAITGTKVVIPEGLYPGEYLIDVANDLVTKYSDTLLQLSETDMRDQIKDFTLSAMMNLIKKDLSDLGVKHDIFTSEATFVKNGKIDEAIAELQNMNLVYEGILPPPKGKIDESWSEKKQLLFKSTSFGDEQDRTLKKHDDSWSYFASDCAYVQDKINRGFENLIFILGADHSGYIKRIESLVAAFGKGKVRSNVQISQLVKFVKDGNQIKMSKRSGNFLTVRDIINEVGGDTIRFMMLTRRSDMMFDFDFNKVKEQTKDNPIFYVQYAVVRAISILNNAKELTPEAYQQFENNDYDLSLLSTAEEIELIKLLSFFPKTLESSSVYFEPHRIAYYLIDLAAKFHAIWNLGKENNDYRFVIEKNDNLTASRLALVKGVEKIISYGLQIIGITPMQKM